MNEPKTYYRRHLPHYQPLEAEYHVVFRLAGLLPAEVIEQLRQERDIERKRIVTVGSGIREQADKLRLGAAYFAKFDKLLDSASSGPRWLADQRVAALVAEAIHFRDKTQYDLYAFTVMPNHVHMVLATVRRADLWRAKSSHCPTYTVTQILQKLKWNTALKANRILNRSGAFWQDESYDHVIRTDEELERTLQYVLNNPVQAALVSSWEQWPWTYWKGM
jgi:REP element-mobilizing transposase RayT